MIKKLFILFFLLTAGNFAYSQCAVCKATISSSDDKAAKGINGGILYLAAMPLAFMGFLGYRWWKQYKDTI